MKKGQYYEEKTADLVQKFNPQAQILQGVRVVGKLSNLKREVDVHLIDPSTYDNIVFECKDHKAKVDIELVEALVTKLQDVGTKKGAVVSNSGFTKGAYRIAQAHGIDLLSIVDTNDEKIKTRVFAPHIVEDLYVQKGFLQLEGIHGEFRPHLSNQSTVIKTGDGDMTWPNILAKHWNEVGIKNSIGPGEYFLETNNATIVDHDSQEISVDRLTIIYTVKHKFYQRDVELLNTQGIYNVAKNTYQTSSIQSEVIKVADFTNPKIWKTITEEQAKSMNVPIRMVCATLMQQQS